MIDPGDRRQARGDTGGEDRLIESQQIICRNAGVQAQIDAVKIEHGAVVTQRLVELLFAVICLAILNWPPISGSASNNVT